MKQPTKAHYYALTRDPFGNAGIAIKVGRHMDYIYGMFKGRELTGGHLQDKNFEGWYREGDKLPLIGHPTLGDVVLVLGSPGPGDVQELTGDEAAREIREIVGHQEKAGLS